MRRISGWILVSLAIVAGPLLAQESAWTKELKEGAKRDALSDRAQQVRGDSGKWNDDPILQHVAPLEKKPAQQSLDVWADQWLKKDYKQSKDDNTWLIFRTKQLDDNDRVWIERIQRRENQITVVMNQSIWRGLYRKNFTGYQVLAVNLGKLDPGKYAFKWVIKPLEHTKFDGDGRPRNNWPKDDRPTDTKPIELPLTFIVRK